MHQKRYDGSDQSLEEHWQCLIAMRQFGTADSLRSLAAAPLIDYSAFRAHAEIQTMDHALAALLRPRDEDDLL